MASTEHTAAGPAHVHTVMTPPNTDEGNKAESDLSSLDLNEDEEEEEVVPDHYWDGGKIPVFKPTMSQFRSFKDYVTKIDKYGMKSGIVKVIPPQEWRDSLKALDEAVKTIKVKNPITQEISGKAGTYTQANIEKQRSYNLPQWKALTEETQHQPPAKRGERRKMAEKVTRPKAAPKPSSSAAATTAASAAKSRARSVKGRKKAAPQQEPTPSVEGENASDSDNDVQQPPTPTSPEQADPAEPEPKKAKKTKSAATASRSKGNQAKSISERRKYNQQEVAEEIDEESFRDFDYRFYGNDEFTPERCKELEALYWKTLTYAAPMYGADMPGSLFDDSTTSWNVAKLENLLDVLGTKVPGVNTAYLYLGMWKATFAWHLEDVDLYSINYIHFGAPKQWYSISQEDARRFEMAMRTLWPNDSKNCSQFLRHKTYLVSPTLLQEQFNLKVNKLVHYEGEFVITYPYGYHSGYNLGYNCAESVNFAIEDWIEYGKIAKKCNCEADSVWVDAHYIERKLKGEPTPEYYEETDDDDEDLGEDAAADLLTPPASVAGKGKNSRKRKRESIKPSSKPKKKIKIRVKQSGFEPCVLCPNNMPFEKLLPTSTGGYAHSVCALYTPETYIWPEKEVEGGEPQKIYGVEAIAKERLGLKCYFCRNKKGACFQCSAKKCTRAYHATCAAAGGVRVDFGRTPFFVEGGDEYWIEENDFRCRFHRTKRPKHITGEALEKDVLIKSQVPRIKPWTVVQVQFYQSDIFAGVVVENRPEEQTLIIDVLPEGGDRMEVEYKWVLVQDPDDSQLPRPSANCLGPLPDHLNKPTIQNRKDEYRMPMPDDAFVEGCSTKWAEFHTIDPEDAPKFRHHTKVKIDVSKPNHLWHYLGQTSTEVRAHYTEDVNMPRHNPSSSFLDTVKPPPAPVPQRLAVASVQPKQSNPHYHALNSGTFSSVSPGSLGPAIRMDRPYQYKPKALSPSQPAHQQLQKLQPAVGTYNPHVQNSRTHEWVHQMQQAGPTGHKLNAAPVTTNPVQAAKLPHKDLRATSSVSTGTGRPSAVVSNRAQAGENTGPGQSSASNMSVRKGGPPEYRASQDPGFLNHIQRYPYLRAALQRRPRKYTSPYPAVIDLQRTSTQLAQHPWKSVSPPESCPNGHNSLFQKNSPAAELPPRDPNFVPQWVHQQQHYHQNPQQLQSPSTAIEPQVVSADPPTASGQEAPKA